VVANAINDQRRRANRRRGDRGSKDAEARDPGGPAGTLASWLRSRPGVDIVVVEAFPVEPAPGP
jgi:hypothetical protein